MNTIKAQLTRLERGGVVSISADLDGPRARIDARLLREGDDDRDDSVVVWNGMVARFPARHQRSSARLSRTAVRLTDGDCVNPPAHKPYNR
jgi:hypothetical protein